MGSGTTSVVGGVAVDRVEGTNGATDGLRPVLRGEMAAGTSTLEEGVAASWGRMGVDGAVQTSPNPALSSTVAETIAGANCETGM
jgi:hypothetical protein